MNLDMIRHQKETRELLLSIFKNFETLFDQTHPRP